MALVPAGDFGLEPVPHEALELDSDGIAHNLMPDVEYLILDEADYAAWESGDVQVLLQQARDEAFSVYFPTLGRLGLSTNTTLKAQELRKLTDEGKNGR